MMVICDYCKQECKITPFGSCVILTKEDITICIDCNSDRLKLERIKNNQNILKYILDRQLEIKARK